MEDDAKVYIRDEIRRALNIVLSAQSGPSKDVEAQAIDQLYPGQSLTNPRPVVHPYGFASRAVTGIINLVARSGSHLGNLFIIGFRDKKRPPDLAIGESVIYSDGGLKIYLRNGKIQVGSEKSDNPVVLYRELKTLLESILDHIIAHNHQGVHGPTSPPLNSGAFSGDKGNIGTIKSEKVFTEK